eukprot:TRINITY_DN2448_c0_g1_i3.p1 TRINITY_DN2448_c0_g1~~TRINITY_DN2448_c0_g1_i3.p1  ORF type:complete len:512 (+),score=264.10 TRINITY_DN2448_c0_g1_i3:32-1537(+)
MGQLQLLQDEASDEKGEYARLSNFVGAIAITDLVKTTLGPKGMDKILQSAGEGGDSSVTNDGATILKSLHVDNPAAKVLVDISKTQDDEVGDGTTSVCVLAGELLREAEKLVAMKIHPQTIITGWRIATKVALEALEKLAIDNSADSDKFRADLRAIACTTLSSKILCTHKDFFADLAVDAVMRLKGSTNLEAIHVIKKLGGSLKDSFLDEGFILEKKIGIGQPKRLENPRILIANTQMDTDKIKIFSARVRVSSPSELAQLEAIEKTRMLEKCDKILSHGIDCFINRQLVYNLPEQYFTSKGIMAIEHADFDGIERLALVTGAEILSTFDHPEGAKIGTCKLIEEVFVGEDMMIKFSGVPLGEACTIVLRGSSTHLLDEAERSLHDALCVLSQTVKEPRIIYGGGCSEIAMARAVEDEAAKTAGKQSLALEAFARALRMLPTIIADNAGFDSSELVSQLRAAHSNGQNKMGLNMDDGVIADMSTLGITDSFKVLQRDLPS